MHYVDYHLRELTSIKIGGFAADFFMPSTIAELLALCEKYSSPIILSGGTNIIFGDKITRPVISLRTLNHELTRDQNIITVGASVLLAKFIKFAIEHNCGGVELLSGIPGTVGGAIVMNAGTPQITISEHLSTAEVLVYSPHTNWQLRTFTRDELAFAYRSSILQSNGGILISAVFALEKSDKKTLAERAQKTLATRAAQSIKYPNCGSVFKNPSPTISAGKLLDDAQLKNYQVGDLRISPQHANFFENLGNATFHDFMTLLHHAQKTVAEKFNVTLQPEVKIYDV